MLRDMDMFDVLALLGLLLASVGVALVWEPGAGLIVFGGVLCALALRASPPGRGRS